MIDVTLLSTIRLRDTTIRSWPVAVFMPAAIAPMKPPILAATVGSYLPKVAIRARENGGR